MGTKRLIFNTVPNINMSDRKLQPGGKISRDPSPRPPRTAQSEREGDSSREGERRRDRDTDRRRDKERYKDSKEQPRDRYYDRDREPRIRDGERERRQENPNVRPLSNIEKENEKEGDRGARKGDTFPRNARYTMDQIMSSAEMEGWDDKRQRRREDRDRDRPRERDKYRNRPKDEVKGEKSQPRDREREFESRRRDGRDRVVPRKNEPREPRQDRDMYRDRAQRRQEGKRDTRSEGEIDEREWRRERGQDRDREELIYQHSRSEGDTQSRKDRERQEYRDQDRYRDDRPGVRDDRYRENRERERRGPRDCERPRNSGPDDRRREDRYRERDYEQRRQDDRGTGMSSQSQTPRVPSRAQSSGEWSSDMDGEGKVRKGLDDRERREKHRHKEQQRAENEARRQRKMWLDPQRDVDRQDTTLVEETWSSAKDSSGIDTEGVSVDGEIEETEGPGESGDNTEDSEGGSDTAWIQDRDRIMSGEDGFVTLSSNGDDEEDTEEDFKDCVEFWEGDKDMDEEWTLGKEDTVDEENFTEGQDRDTPPKYVFCVIGQTLPRTEKSHAGDDNKIAQNDLNHEYDEVREIVQEERSNPGDQSAVEGVQITGNSHHDFGTIKRDSQTERLLLQWREKNDEKYEEREKLSPVPSNPYADVSIQLPYEQIQSTLEQRNSGGMTPEEEEAIRIRMSGAWSMSEETKRHSQAPHLKWAKNVVREILGQSDEKIDNPPAEIQDKKQDVEIPEIKTEDAHSESEEEEEPLEVEGLRDDEDTRSKSWGELDLRHVLDTIGKRKRNSKFFNAAQLYQQYSEAVQNIEILRQSRPDTLSVCDTASSSPAPSPPPARRPLPPLPSVPHPHSLSHTGSVSSVQSLCLPEPPKSERRASSPRLSVSLTQSATLWRDLPAVRNSPELQQFTADQKRLQEVRFEVVTSEASYCRSLDIVVDHFVKSKQLGVLLTTQDRNWLFSRLADVRAISHSFLTKLEEKVESDVLNFTVCDVIAQHCHRFKVVYVPYLTNQSYQDATYQRLMNENPGFKRIVEKLERSPVCQRLPLRSFLVLPFQRITRIKLLVQNIVKRTTPGTPEATQAIKALRLLEKLIQEGNDSITQMKSIESLVSLSARVDFSAECKTLPLISQSRRLVREGKVTELMDFSLKETERSIYMHLFNDYLLLSIQKEGGRFTVIDHSPVSELRAENCRVKLHSLQKNLFRLHMLHKALLLRTDTQSDKLRWISALSRPHSKVDFSAAQDFSQMQCIRAFVAQQPDELSLEKAEVILVHQQSSDHWVEATRLSDRQRGWVPESHLETISNAEIRQRNLSDALKLTTATAVDLRQTNSGTA